MSEEGQAIQAYALLRSGEIFAQANINWLALGPRPPSRSSDRP